MTSAAVITPYDAPIIDSPAPLDSKCDAVFSIIIGPPKCGKTTLTEKLSKNAATQVIDDYHQSRYDLKELVYDNRRDLIVTSYYGLVLNELYTLNRKPNKIYLFKINLHDLDTVIRYLKHIALNNGNLFVEEQDIRNSVNELNASKHDYLLLTLEWELLNSGFMGYKGVSISTNH